MKTKDPSTSSKPLRIGAFLPLDVGFGREFLRGLARFYREFDRIEVLKFNQTRHYDPAKLHSLGLSGAIAKIASLRDEKAWAQTDIPVVNISSEYQPRGIPSVNADDDRVGRMAARHLSQRGYRQFAYCGDAKHQASRARLKAFSAELASTLDAEAATVAEFSAEQADLDAPFSDQDRQRLNDWVRNLPKPIAIFAFTDRLSLELDEVARQHRLSVPQDMAILGVGNDLMRIEFAHTPLSSIQLPNEEIAYLAAELLEKWISYGASPPLRTTLRPSRLFARASTDALAVSDDTVAIAVDYLRENLGNPIRVDQVARYAGISRRALEIRFRRHLGKSIYETALDFKFELALDLLAQPDILVSDIAYRIGYPDTKSFSRAFRQRFKKSPSEHRRL